MGLIDSKRVERLYEQVLRTRKDCSFADLERLLVAVGFENRHGSGSHVFFKRGDVAISIPRRKPVKEHYVEQVIAIVDSLASE